MNSSLKFGVAEFVLSINIIKLIKETINVTGGQKALETIIVGSHQQVFYKYCTFLLINPAINSGVFCCHYKPWMVFFPFHIQDVGKIV